MNKITALLAVTLLGVMAFSGCEVPLAPSGRTNAGRVTVSFAEGPARTVFPVKDFERYQFFFTHTGGEETEMTPNEGTSGAFSLDAGNWSLRVRAYASSGDTDPAAEGTAQFAVTGGQEQTVTVKLSPFVNAGKGNFTYDITFTGLTGGEQPETRALELRKLTEDGTPGEPVMLTGTSGSVSVDSGYYALNARFALGDDEAGVTEVVHIYRNLTTEYRATFDRAGFSLVRVRDVTLGAIEPLNLNNKKTARLIAQIIPAEATNRGLRWASSDAAVASVDPEGQVTAVSAGTAVITVTTVDGGKTAELEVTVLSNETGINGIAVNQVGTALNNGIYTITVAYETESGTVNVSPRHENAVVEFLKGGDFVTDNTVNFNEGSNTITIRVTAEDGVTLFNYTLIVNREARGVVPVTGVTLVQQPAAPLKDGEVVTLIAEITPSDATVQTLDWDIPSCMELVSASSDTRSVTVRAVSRGSGMIKATANNGQNAECAVEVIQRVTSIVITPAADQTLIAGKPGFNTVQLTAEASPLDANNRAITWTSSDSSVAGVTSGGLVSVAGTVSGVGVVTITASAADGNGASTSKIIAIRPMSGDTGIKTVTVNGAVVGAESDGNYKYTVENNITSASIGVVVNDPNAAAEYTAENPLAIGDNVIQVKLTAENGSPRQYTVTVHRKKIPVSSLTLPEIAEQLTGAEFTVTASINSDATYQGVTWAIGGGLAKVSENGLTVTVRAVSGGTGTITVTSVDDPAQTLTRNVAVRGQGDANVTFSWDGAGEVINNAPVTVQQGEAVTIAVQDEEVSGYRWYVNGVEDSGATGARDYTFSQTVTGTYLVTIRAVKNNKPCSVVIEITVE